MTNQQEECVHEFKLASIQMESPFNAIYRQVGYAVCEKCGEIRKTEL